MVLKVVIVGGGIGGLSAALALRQHPGIDVQVYERARELREIGALIGLCPNGARTLEKLGVHEALEDDIGWRSPNGVPMAIRHYQTNEMLSENYNIRVPDKKHHFARMHRRDLHNAIRKHVPESIVHLGKRATSVETDEHGATVQFEDGTSVRADLIVAADGIKSVIRRGFLPDHEIHWSGDVIFRTTFPYSLVEDIPGLPQDSIHYHSPGSWIFPSRLGANGFGVTASYKVNDYDASAKFKDIVWDSPAEVSDLKELFKNFCHPIPTILDRIPEGTLRKYANVVGAGLDKWSFNNRVTLLGDAAHTHGGTYAAGANLAIDDGYALYLALRAVFAEASPIAEPVSADQIGRALRLYEETRRPHVARLIDEVHVGLRKRNARDEAARLAGIPETDEAFRARTALRDGTWLFEHDVEGAFRKVLLRETQAGRLLNGTSNGTS